ncbi:phosphate ABC transporter substrate-binding protein [Gemmatimonas sp.]
MPRYMMRLFLGVAVWCTAALGLAMTPSTAAAQGFKVIVHNDVAAAEITTAALSNIFLKKDSKFPGGPEAVPVDLPASAPLRDVFSKAVHGRSTAAVVTFWQQQVFSGKDTPPPTKPTDEAVVAFVKGTPGAIGYVRDGTATDGVKVVKLK